ncbi:histidine phosphatase family protein [Sagittula sp. NFXS13]|uniref:SixA phosphatase family protein n=1 Tax=Sagittula sp. NFXS13 TaxID=2819095 RepID=UPI0032DF94B5
MKRLILMRHAKSDWSAGTADANRPLNARGRRSAEAMGQWLRDMGHIPDEILCSSATRTRETLDLLALKAPTSYRKSLYLADSQTMLSALHGASGDCVLMLGHNPGVGQCAHMLVSQEPEHERFDDYPTCATLVAEFDIEKWEDLLPGSGAPLGFAVGRDLTD